MTNILSMQIMFHIHPELSITLDKRLEFFNLKNLFRKLLISCTIKSSYKFLQKITKKNTESTVLIQSTVISL